MATLDTTRLIQPALTAAPAPTTTIQPKPAEGFQRLLDEETHKVSNPLPQPRTAVKSESRPAGARSEASTKVTERKAAARDSKSEGTDISVKPSAESTPRQDLPSEETEEISGSSVSTTKEDAAPIVKSQEPAPGAQTSSAAALLASLLVQTTGDLKGTQVTDV